MDNGERAVCPQIQAFRMLHYPFFDDRFLLCKGDLSGTPQGREQAKGNREQEVLLPRFLLQTLGF